MVKAALTYGVMMYVLSGRGFLGPQKDPFQYQDQPIDF
jgi:hypothetical protein